MQFKLFGLIFSISRPKTVSVPDFMQEAKIAAIRFVPKDSDKVYYILGRFAHATGAMREFLRNNPEERCNPAFTKQIMQATNLWHQFDSAPLIEVTYDIERIAQQVLREDVRTRVREILQEDNSKG